MYIQCTNETCEGIKYVLQNSSFLVCYTTKPYVENFTVCIFKGNFRHKLHCFQFFFRTVGKFYQMNILAPMSKRNTGKGKDSISSASVLILSPFTYPDTV